MAASDPIHRNEVLLVGRVTGEPETRRLPSGDEITTWRLIVTRAEPDDGRPQQDTLDCTAWTARTRKAASAWQAGDVLEVEGAIRRRFWKTAAALASRCEIEVSRARRVSRSAPRPRTP